MFDWPKFLRRFWPAIILALALLLIVDGTISSLETCHPPPNSASSGQNSDKDCTVLQGPLISLIVGIGDFVGDHDKGIVAAFTAVLAIFTARLWWATRALVVGAEDTAQRDLRAYVLLEDTFFIYEGEQRFDAPDRKFTDIHKLRIKNFGRTPAFDLSIWLRRSPNEIADDKIDGLLVKTHSEQALAPGHRYGPNFPIEDGFRHTDNAFVYGKFVYRDIYERWWVTRFCWQYRPNIRWTPYSLHNREDGPFNVKPS
jgi:hypothetical protein